MRYDNIEQFPRAHFEIDVALRDLVSHVQVWTQQYGLTLDPDYQRAHVWTEAQQVAYVEHILRDGEVGKTLILNSNGWNEGTSTSVEVVDGKQRLTAMLRFVQDELRVFHEDIPGGVTCTELGGPPPRRYGFKWRVVDLDRVGILKLYLSLNGGGTQHTPEELDRVRALLAKEQVP